MKKLLLAITLLPIWVSYAYSQEPHISTAEPMISSYTTIYEGKNRIILAIKFRDESDPAKSIPLSALQPPVMKATITDGEPDRMVQLETRGDNDKSLLFRFLIDVGQTSNTFFLQNNWKSFRYRVFYKYTKDGTLMNGESSLIPIDRRSEEITLTARWNTPLWFNETKKKQMVSIPVSIGPAIGVKLSLFRKGETNPVATGEDVTAKDSFKYVKLEPKSINISEGDEFKVKLEPLGLPITLENSEFEFRITSKSSFEIDESSLNFLKNKLVVISEAKVFPIQVTTTSQGVFQMSFDGGQPKSPKSTTGTVHTFELTDGELKKLEDKAYSVSFSGTSFSGIALEGEKSFTLVKTTKPELVGTSTFKVDGEFLVVTYTLSKEIDNQWFLSDLDGKSLKVTDKPTCQVKNGLFECVAKVSLKASEIVRSVESLKDNTLLVKLEIQSTAVGSAGESIASFAFNLINAGQVKQKLEEVKTGLENKTMNEETAKQKVANALGLKSLANPQTDESKQQQESIDYVVSLLGGRDRKGKDRFMSTLKFAGNVAASFFGIPIRIP